MGRQRQTFLPSLTLPIHRDFLFKNPISELSEGIGFLN
jgi:hypothetical protein